MDEFEIELRELVVRWLDGGADPEAVKKALIEVAEDIDPPAADIE